MKHFPKALVIPAFALAMAFAFIACNGEQTPDVTYSVTYVIGEEAQGTAPTETNKAVGEKFIIKSADGITNGNLTFMGWSDGNIIYQAGDEYTMPTKAVTFTAQWEDTSCIRETYSVTYDLDGGTGTVPTESNKAKGEKFKLASADGLKNGGLNFDGWSDGKNKYDAGAEYTMPENAVTFTAQWKDKEQPEQPKEPQKLYVAYELDDLGTILLYDNNTGLIDYADADGDDKQIKFTYNLSGTAIAITIGEDTFDGTYDGSLLTVQIDYANTAFKFGAKQEKPKGKPTIEFSANGGTGAAPEISDDDITYIASAEMYRVNLPENTYTPPEGKEFIGWNINDQKDALGNPVTVNSKSYIAAPEEKVTIKPLWKDVEVPVTKGIEFIGECTLPEKKVFGGTQGGETVVKIIIDKSDADNLKIYYKLKNDDKEYASKNVAPNRYLPKEVYGEDALYYDLTIENVLYTVVIKADFTKLTLCDQTSDEPLDNGEFVVSGSVVDPPEQTDEVTVAFDLGYEGGAAIASQKFENGGKAVAPETPTRDGYVFDGWHLGVAGGEEFDFDTAVTANITLVAKWLKQYTVTYVKPDGAIGEAPEVQTVVEGEQVLLPAECPFTKAGWTFSGWAVTGYPALRASNTKITVTQNTTITAVFSVVYSGALGDYTLRDNGTGADEEGAFTYTRNGDIVTIVEYMLALKVNDTDKTYDLQDGMQNLTFTAANNTTLTFDGFGAATLGTHSGTYTVLSNTTFTLIFGDDTYSAIELNGEYPNFTISVTITIDDTDYVFGSVQTDPPATDKLADYIGVKYGYASANDAKTANQGIIATNSSNAEKTFYQAQVNTNYAGKLGISIYYSSFNSVGSPKGSDGQDIEVNDDTPNQTVYINSSSWANQFVITFSRNGDGKRVMTITYGDITVTWVEMSA